MPAISSFKKNASYQKNWKKYRVQKISKCLWACSTSYLFCFVWLQRMKLFFEPFKFTDKSQLEQIHLNKNCSEIKYLASKGLIALVLNVVLVPLLNVEVANLFFYKA